MKLSTPTAIALLLGAAFSAHAGQPIPAPADQPYPGTIVMKVDASNTAQNIVRIQQTIPARPGKMTLLFPQWVTAQHGPTGALNQFAGFKASANGKPLSWRRDNVNVFAFHLDVPAGVQAIEVEYQHLAPTEAAQGRTSVTPDMLIRPGL